MKARRVALLILSLIYLVALAIFAYSPVVRLTGRVLGEAPAAQTEESPAARTGTEISLPFVTPKVALNAGSFPQDTETLTAVLLPGETALLDQFTQLRSADLSGSTAYEELAAWAQQHPAVDVSYSVALPDGTSVSNKATSLDLSRLDAAGAAQAASLLAALPAVQTVEIGALGSNGFTAEGLAALQQSFPNTAFHYSFQLMGQNVSPDTDSLDLSAASAEEIASVIPMLGSLPNLRTVHLGAEGSSAVSWDNIWSIAQACPAAVLDFGFTIWGVPANLSDSELNLSHVSMDDEGSAVYNVLPLMRNCSLVDMDSCGVSNEAMCNIRDANPNVKVVWRIWFGQSYSVRTDVIKILASKPSKGGMITNDDVAALSCCTSLKYLDLGHNDELTDCSFFYSMPDIEVVILTLTGVSDITPLASCPHLEYLEVTHTTVSDLSPLANATELRHLNIGDSQVYDITPLYGLSELERLYICARHHVPQDQIDEMQRIAPECEINTDQDDPSNGYWRYSPYVPAEAYYQFQEQGLVGFPFVNHPRYELLREQFGYANEEYAFYWLDPLY